MRQASRFWAKLGAGVSCCAALAGFFRLLIGNPEGAQILSLGSWFRTGPHDVLAIAIAFQFDITTAALAVVMSLATGCALAFSRPELSDPQSERLQDIGASLLLFSSLGILLSSNLAELFVFWQIAAAAGYAMELAHSETAWRGGAKKFIVTQRIADGFLLLVVFTTAAGFGTLDLHDLFGRPAAWVALGKAQSVLAEVIALCLLGACIVRCGLIPIVGAAGDLATKPALVTVLVEAACLMPAGVLLLIRCQPVFDAAAATATLAAFLGASSAFVLAVCAWANDDLRRSAGYACASLFGMLVFGLASLEDVNQSAALILLLAYIPTATVVLAAFAEASQEMATNRERPGHAVEQHIGPVRWSLILSIIVLFAGVSGQGLIVAGGVKRIAQFGREAPGSLALATVLAALAEFFAAWAIVRALITGRVPQRIPNETSPTIIEATLVGNEEWDAPGRGSNWPLMLLATCGASIGLFAVTLNRPGAVRVFAGGLPALLGFASALWQARRTQGSAAGWPSNGVLTRLGRSGFYCDAMLFLFVVLPLRGGAQLARFFDWFLIDGVVWGVPASLLDSATVLLEPIQRRSPAFYLLSMVFGTAVLAGVIVWLRGA